MKWRENQAQIDVTISDIEIDDKYYSFKYTVWLDGNVVKKGSYENDHSWRNDQGVFKEHLESGGAVKIALEQTF